MIRLHGFVSKKKAPAPQRREYIERWLESLRAGNLSALSADTRRRQITKLRNDLKGSLQDITAEASVHWFAAEDWKPETRKGCRNATSSFFEWLFKSGRAVRDVSKDLLSVRRSHAHPRPCSSRVILVALSKANEAETLMIRLAAECGRRRAEIAHVRQWRCYRRPAGQDPHSPRQGRQATLGALARRPGSGDYRPARLAAARPLVRARRDQLCRQAHRSPARRRMDRLQPPLPVCHNDLPGDSRLVPGQQAAGARVG